MRTSPELGSANRSFSRLDLFYCSAYHWSVQQKIVRLEQIVSNTMDMSEAGYDSDDGFFFVQQCNRQLSFLL